MQTALTPQIRVLLSETRLKQFPLSVLFKYLNETFAKVFLR